MRTSVYSKYRFKRDYYNICVIDYENMVTNYDNLVLNREHNEDKMSWKSYYYLYCDEKDNVHISKQELKMTWRV